MRLTREKYLEKTPWIRSLEAVKRNRLIILSGGKDEDLAHPGPSLLEATRKLRSLLQELRRRLEGS